MFPLLTTKGKTMAGQWQFAEDFTAIRSQIRELVEAVKTIERSTCTAEEADFAAKLLRQLISAEQSITDVTTVPW